MAAELKKLTLSGFTSIKSLVNFEFTPINILIGANGAGKSNFVNFFRMLRALANEGLQNFVNEQGGADSFFFLGPKHTRSIEALLEFGQNRYKFRLTPTADSGLQVSEEVLEFTNPSYHVPKPIILSTGTRESQLKVARERPGKTAEKGIEFYVYESISKWTVYHFHDSSSVAPMRREQPSHDKRILQADASNIAPFLYNLREADIDRYHLIRDTIRRVAPFFDDFILNPVSKGDYQVLSLEWRQVGSDFPFKAYNLSDGTIRFICLAAALLQPAPPPTIVIDEPELGLHPDAVALFSELVKLASNTVQVILSTQSPTLLSYFSVSDIVLVNRINGASTFSRPTNGQLTEWLEDYSIGELWQKNVVSAGPQHE